MTNDNVLTEKDIDDIRDAYRRQSGCPDPECSVCKANARRAAACEKAIRLSPKEAP